jgi:hypothetical protein
VGTPERVREVQLRARPAPRQAERAVLRGVARLARQRHRAIVHAAQALRPMGPGPTRERWLYPAPPSPLPFRGTQPTPPSVRPRRLPQGASDGTRTRSHGKSRCAHAREMHGGPLGGTVSRPYERTAVRRCTELHIGAPREEGKIGSGVRVDPVCRGRPRQRGAGETGGVSGGVPSGRRRVVPRAGDGPLVSRRPARSRGPGSSSQRRPAGRTCARPVQPSSSRGGGHPTGSGCGQPSGAP